jgi:hypothetical protein
MRFAAQPLAAFVIVQCTDAWLTATGIERFGFSIEANPIVAWYAQALGVGLALLMVKSVAVACATALHVQSRHRTLTVLTGLYIVVAIIPWMLTLWR